MTRTNYLKATGEAAISPTCYDKNGHCKFYIKRFGKGCCKNKAGKNKVFKLKNKAHKLHNKSLASACCASCAYAEESQKCGGTRPADPARLADQATYDVAKKNAAIRKAANSIRRCEEDGGTNC